MYASTATNLQERMPRCLPLIKHRWYFPGFILFLSIIQFVTGVDPIKAGAMINATLFAVVFSTSADVIPKP